MANKDKKKKTPAPKLTPSQQAVANAGLPVSVQAQPKTSAATVPSPTVQMLSGAGLPIPPSVSGARTSTGTPSPTVQMLVGAGLPVTPSALNVPTITTPVKTTPPPTPAVDDVVAKIAMQKLAEYGLEGIADSIKRAREAYPELEITDLLFLVENDDRYNKPFKDRFKANELRFKQGLPKLSARDYLTMEQGYRKIFTTYNLPMFNNQNQYDKLIAGDVDTDDVTNRVVMAYDRVMTDTSTRNAFRQFYGTLTDADIASALLDPTQQIPALEKKVMAAEIGGQSLRQGLATSEKELQAMVTPEGRQVSGYANVQRGTMGAAALAAEGVTETAAAQGYERIAEQLPAAEKLSSIYAGRTAQVGQKELEQAEILGLESAKRKQRQLAAIEEATFAGEAGTMRTSLGRRGKQGAF